jgi:outer membrane receptor protein involved in Fe transport
LFDGRVVYDTSIYYEDWRDIQISFRNPNGQVYVTNAGNARSYGWENELSLHPTPDWEFDADWSLGRAELTTSNPGILLRSASARGPAIYGVSAGDPLPGSQKVNASLGAQYNLPKFGPGESYVRADEVYVGGACVDFTCNGSLKVGDYNLLNLRAGYRLHNYEVVLFADNVLNSDGVENAIPDVNGAGLTDAAYRVKPRVVGITVKAKY